MAECRTPAPTLGGGEQPEEQRQFRGDMIDSYHRRMLLLVAVWVRCPYAQPTAQRKAKPARPHDETATRTRSRAIQSSSLFGNHDIVFHALAHCAHRFLLHQSSERAPRLPSHGDPAAATSLQTIMSGKSMAAGAIQPRTGSPRKLAEIGPSAASAKSRSPSKRSQGSSRRNTGALSEGSNEDASDDDLGDMGPNTVA